MPPYGLIYKFLGRQQKDNLFILDGKGEELCQRWYLDLPNVGAEQKKKYLITSKIENLMDRRLRYRFKDKSDSPSG